MKSRCKRGLGELSTEFVEFRDFLRHVGPAPDGFTLDRVDCTNPIYGPGTVRWLGRRGQANNRSTTIYLTHLHETLPLSYWAERTGQSAATMRQRHSRRWSDEEVIFGRARARTVSSDDWPGPQTPDRLERWENIYRQRQNLASLEGETRLECFIRVLGADIAVAEQFILGAQEVVAYVRRGHIPMGQDEGGVVGSWESDFARAAPEIIERQIADAQEFVGEARVLIEEAHKYRAVLKRGT